MPAEAKRGYGRGASILSVGIATTGLVTFAYFSLASHSLSEVDYKGVSLLWSILFLIISIIYRPVEQLLSHTIAARRALANSHDQASTAISTRSSSMISGFGMLNDMGRYSARTRFAVIIAAARSPPTCCSQQAQKKGAAPLSAAPALS